MKERKERKKTKIYLKNIINFNIWNKIRNENLKYIKKLIHKEGILVWEKS